MTKQQLVERTKSIRKDILKITQSELAEAIGTSQALVSRMELDGKGTIDLLLDILNFYETKGIKKYMVLLPDFSTSMLLKDGDTNKSEILKIINILKKELDQLETKVNYSINS
jgi:predicted transcriptional regulator